MRITTSLQSRDGSTRSQYSLLHNPWECVSSSAFGGTELLESNRPSQYSRMRLLATKPPSTASMVRAAMRSAL